MTNQPWQAGAPQVAVLMPVFRPQARFLRHAIMSVLQQTLDEWQLVIVDDASQDAAVAEVLAWAGADRRVKVVTLAENRGISGASNAGLELVTAPYVALLDHDDFLEPSALAQVVVAAGADPSAEVIYSDRDAVDENNIPTEVFHKPDWSPQRLRGNMYLAHLTVLATTAVRDVGGFRTQYDGAQDHDLVLRVVERGNPVIHVPEVLYHWRQLPQSTASDPAAKPYAAESGLRAVQAHLDRTGRRGTVVHSPFAGFYHCQLAASDVLASIVIPTRGGRSVVGEVERVMVVEAVRSILARNYGVQYELVIVHDEAAEDSYLATLRELAADRLKVVQFPGPFNFSAKINRGVAESSGEVVVLLNDDVEVVTDRWLDQLVALAQEPDVGAVGAKLLFEDGAVQHAGHYFAKGQVGHIGSGEPDGPGHFGANLLDREVVGVTAACLAQRRDVWEHLGGMDEALPNNFNDVDYCLRIRAKGYRIVQANSVVLHHYESRTRTANVRWWEASRIIDRLGDQLSHDPYTPDRIGLLKPVDEPPPRRDLREWVRVTRVVAKTEGPKSLAVKAGRRLTGRRRELAETERIPAGE